MITPYNKTNNQNSFDPPKLVKKSDIHFSYNNRLPYDLSYDNNTKE